MINLGIIGCGYWGPNLLRNFYKNSNCRVVRIAELDDARLHYIHEKYPSVQTTKDYYDLLTPDIDAVVISTEPRQHFQLAKEALKHNKHVLIEKPMAQSVREAEELLVLAEEQNRKIMVGHTFEYNEAVRELKRQMDARTIGKPYYITSQRLNFGIVRKDVNALWSLAPHDISILIYVLGCMPESVSCRGFDFIQKDIEDIVFLMLKFPNDVVAHVHVSWLDPSKARRMALVGSEKMIIYDDMADSKIQIYDKGIKKQNIKDSMGRFDDFGTYQLIKTAGDCHLPKIDFQEPLKVECNHFVDSIIYDRPVLTDGPNGLRVIQVLEAAQQSMNKDGETVNIEMWSPVPQGPGVPASI